MIKYKRNFTVRAVWYHSVTVVENGKRKLLTIGFLRTQPEKKNNEEANQAKEVSCCNNSLPYVSTTSKHECKTIEVYLRDFLNSSISVRFMQTAGSHKLRVAHAILPSSVLIDGELIPIPVGQLLFVTKGGYGREFVLGCFLEDPKMFGVMEAKICAFEKFPPFSSNQIRIVSLFYESAALRKAGFQNFAPNKLRDDSKAEMIAIV